MAKSSNSVRIVEVGPRDGLQNVKAVVPTAVKTALIARLCDAGLQTIEITSTVSPKAIPQLADCRSVMADARVQSIIQNSKLRAPVLVPNLKGMQVAMSHGIREVAVFVSASEGFSQANIKCNVQDGLDRAREVAESSRKQGMSVRGYVSCIFACPFDGATPSAAVLKCVQQLRSMGCYEISLGDTVGVGAPADVTKLINYLIQAGVPVGSLAGHFHDTYGQAIANVWAAYHCGIRVFDSSVGGLGGCPYAPGAKGNLATEDLVYSLHRAGIITGANLPKLVEIGRWITSELEVPNSSRAGSALAIQSGRKSTTSKPVEASVSLTWVSQPAVEGLEISRSGTNIKIVLNRPKNGNALNNSMIEGLTTVFERSASESSITRIVVAASGKFFCTGMDLSKDSSPVAQGGAASDSQFDRLTRLFEAIDNAPQVTIACIQGPAFGGGVGLAFACDIRIMAKGASMTLSETRLGLAPATISKYVTREWGAAFTREAILTARTVSTTELKELGAVHEVVEPASTLPAVVDGYLIRLKGVAPHASALGKELVRLSWRDGGGGQAQANGIRHVFDDMMSATSESAFGLKQFQARKTVDWDEFQLSRHVPKALL